MTQVIETVKPAGGAEFQLWPSLRHRGLSHSTDLPVWEGLCGRRRQKVALNLLPKSQLPKLDQLQDRAVLIKLGQNLTHSSFLKLVLFSQFNPKLLQKVTFDQLPPCQSPTPSLTDP